MSLGIGNFIQTWRENRRMHMPQKEVKMREVTIERGISRQGRKRQDESNGDGATGVHRVLGLRIESSVAANENAVTRDDGQEQARVSNATPRRLPAVRIDHLTCYVSCRGSNPTHSSCLPSLSLSGSPSSLSASVLKLHVTSSCALHVLGQPRAVLSPVAPDKRYSAPLPDAQCDLTLRPMRNRSQVIPLRRSISRALCSQHGFDGRGCFKDK